ncbi:hypothetical protein BS78_09G245000 [Paspalum vaginatum]|nr:hypothetical protein BS78_09G245000 [Paspalum vaginatum]
MAVSSISCSLRPPAPAVREASARLQPPPRETATPWSSGGLRRACVAAAAACVVIGAAGGVVAAASTPPHGAVAVDAAAPRWSDRRECPPWRANSLENIVPENLPRPSARRRFNSIEAPKPKRGPAALGRPQAVAPFLALPPGMDDCFSL